MTLEMARDIKMGITAPDIGTDKLKFTLCSAIDNLEKDGDYSKFRQRIGAIKARYGEKAIKKMFFLK